MSVSAFQQGAMLYMVVAAGPMPLVTEKTVGVKDDCSTSLTHTLLVGSSLLIFVSPVLRTGKTRDCWTICDILCWRIQPSSDLKRQQWETLKTMLGMPDWNCYPTMASSP